MLMNDFYTVHEWQLSDSTASCIVVFNQKHPIFSGHFPEQPVVPGVCMIQMVKELLERVLDKKLMLRSTGQVKFLQLITPDISSEINMDWQKNEQGFFCKCIF